MGCIQERQYSLVDVDGLSTCMAETDWKAETQNITTEDLYDLVVDDQGCVKNVVKGYWASAFFSLKETYLYLIAHFLKDNIDGNQEEGRNN